MGAEICTDELKKLELAVLCYIREKCRENGLRYYMMYGTLIGAVRHKGFIPWDDDVDIAMFREDFMRLMHAVAADKESPYEVVSMYNVPDFAFPLAKVVDTRTSLVQHGVIGTHEKLGAYVDVFIIDAVPDDEEEYRALQNRVRAWNRRWYMSKRKIVLRKGQLLKDVCAALASLPYKLRTAMQNVRQLDRICAAYAGAETKRASVLLFAQKIDESTLTKEEWENTAYVEFEGETFSTVACWDKLLRRTYGDYMQLPSTEERVSIHSFDVFWKEQAESLSGEKMRQGDA